MSSLRVPRREFSRLVTTLFCGHSDPSRESYTRLLSSLSGAPIVAIEAVICGDAFLPQGAILRLRDAIERRLDSDAGREACERFRLDSGLLKAEVLGPPSGWPEGIAARLNLAAVRREDEGKESTRKAASKKPRPSSKGRSTFPGTVKLAPPARAGSARIGRSTEGGSSGSCVTRPTTPAYNRVREIAIPSGWPDDVEAPVAAMPCIPNGPLECDVPSRYGYLVSFARQMTGQSSGREASLQLLRAMALIERVRLDGALRGRHDLDDEELRRLEIVASNLPWQVWGASDPCRARPVAY